MNSYKVGVYSHLAWGSGVVWREIVINEINYSLATSLNSTSISSPSLLAVATSSIRLALPHLSLQVLYSPAIAFISSFPSLLLPHLSFLSCLFLVFLAISLP